MEIETCRVDAFCKELSSVNLAAVRPLAEWPADALMQQIATGNNLPESERDLQRKTAETA